MAIDDPLGSVAREVEEITKQTLQDNLKSSGAAALLSMLPLGIGAPIGQSLTDSAFKRTYERMSEMFGAMRHRLDEVEQGRISKEWFTTEEFHALLFEAIQQVHAVYDREKLRMLGTALANSGVEGLTSAEKDELFIRVIRDLTSSHIRCLKNLVPDLAGLPGNAPPDITVDEIEAVVWRDRPQLCYEKGENLLILHMLSSDGLVTETLHRRIKEPTIGGRSASSLQAESELRSAFHEFMRQLNQPPTPRFRLSELGRDFLQYVGLYEVKREIEAYVRKARGGGN